MIKNKRLLIILICVTAAIILSVSTAFIILSIGDGDPEETSDPAQSDAPEVPPDTQDKPQISDDIPDIPTEPPIDADWFLPEQGSLAGNGLTVGEDNGFFGKADQPSPADPPSADDGWFTGGISTSESTSLRTENDAGDFGSLSALPIRPADTSSSWFTPEIGTGSAGGITVGNDTQDFGSLSVPRQ